MSSKVEICNLALSHIGVGKEIANLETEASEEASACRRFFDPCRDIVLRDFPWPFATKIVTLALVEENPNDEWRYSYQQPADSIRLKRILSGIRNDTQQSRVPYRVVRGSSGNLIYTDQQNAELEYSFKETDPQRYPPDFVIALSFRLAGYLAPRLTGGDPFKLGQRSLEMYVFEIRRAEGSASNEEQRDMAPDSEFIRVRESDDFTPGSRQSFLDLFGT